MPKLKIATNKMHTWPHFASHTQSSLMKTRTPMKLKKLSSIKNENESKSQKSVVPKSKGIYKKRSNITKQSKSMQMLVMILKQKDRHSNFFLPGDELTETTCQLENSLISFQDNLIKDVSHNLKNCIASPAKLATLRSKRTKVMNEFGSFAENLHDSSQDGTNCAGRDNSDDTYDSEACTVIDVTCKLQLHLSDEEDPTDSCSKVEDLHRRTECEEKPDDISDKDCTEIQVHPQGVNIRKHMRKTWMLRKARIQNEHVNVDRTCADLQKSETTQHVGTVVNNDAIIQKRGDPKKNLTFYQRGWRPAGVLKNFTKSTTSLQPMSQKSSQSTENPSASTKSKHLSTECIKSFNSESTRTSETQSKMLMKENRDPHANRTKMFDHLADIKQQQRLQSEGMLPKKKWSRTKIPSKVLDRCDDTKPTLAKSKSRHCQTRPIILDKSSNNIEQHRTKSNLTYSKSKTSEIIHTLRKIIDSVRKNDDAEENVKKNDDIDHEKNDNNKIQMSSNSDTLQNDELHSAKDINLDRADRSSRRSISTQVKLDSPSYHEIDAEKDQDLMEILNLTRIIATQTLPSHIRNVVDVGCNTPAIVYKDVEISCDLIGSTDLTEIESTMIEDKSMSNVHTESSSIKHIKVNVENEDINENKELLLNECKETLNTRLENCDSIEIPANTINDAAGEIEKFIREEVYRIFLKSFKNSDKTNVDINEKQESAKCSSNHNVSNTSINNLFSEKSQSFICDYDTSCSSEDIMEYLENNIQQDVFMSESKVEDLTSDVIATFELAADRARNLHEAVIIYHKNLMSKESGKRNEEMVEDYEMLEFSDEQNCSEGYTSISRENENKIRSECDAICHFANNEDFDGFSTCSSRGSSYDRTCRTKFLRSSKDWDYYVGMEREEENAIFSGNEQTIARSILNKRSNLEDVKSMMQLVHRTQEDYALELLESDKSDESFKMERIKNDKILALPPVTKKPSFISRQYLLSFFYCIVYTVVFWYLQYSFRCDSKK